MNTATMTQTTESAPVVATTPQLQQVTPLVDIYENNDELLVFVEMAGVQKEDVSVTVEDGTLFLRGAQKNFATGTTLFEEFSAAEYRRTFNLPQSIDTEKLAAKMENGVLKITLPKSEAVKPRVIKISHE